MTRQTLCPLPEDWQRYSQGDCSVAEAADLAEHLAHCDRCLNAVHTLQLEESLIGVLQKASPGPEGLGTKMAMLAQRLRGSCAASHAENGPFSGPTALLHEADPQRRSASRPDLDFLAPPEGP